MAMRNYREILTKEEKLQKAKEALSDPLALVAHFDDRTKSNFFKLLARKMGLEFNEWGEADKAEALRSHFRAEFNGKRIIP
jgi:hypothetical protein